ncbi:MAG TPA: PQQ-binding-like beta-propeller repeat protein [Longimicrobiales bacterium]
MRRWATGDRRWLRPALVGLLAFGLPACSRTARPVEVPDALSPWPTVLESARRDAWLDEQVPRAVRRSWTVDLGRGVLGPLAIESGLLFATTVDRRLIVLEAANGEFYWERRTEGASPAGAVFDRAAVFVASQDRDGAAEAYELARGFALWSVEIAPPVGAPVLHGNVTYWGTETGNVIALNASDGSRLWRTDLAGAVTGSPIVDGNDLLVVTSADTLYRIDQRTGRVGARLPLPSTATSTAAFDGRMLHLPMHDTTHVVVDVRDWRVASAQPVDAPIRATPILDRSDNAWLLAENGDVWRAFPGGALTRVARLGGAARASLAVAGNGILVGRLDGALFFLGFDGTVIWREDFDDSIDAPAAVYDGRVYVPMLRGDMTVLEAAS